MTTQSALQASAPTMPAPTPVLTFKEVAPMTLAATALMTMTASLDTAMLMSAIQPALLHLMTLTAPAVPTLTATPASAITETTPANPHASLITPREITPSDATVKTAITNAN